MKTQLAFVRYHKELENLVAIEIGHSKSLKDQCDVLEAMELALNEWISKTEEGKIAWEYSCEDFNIGDLLNCTDSYMPFFKKQGITSLKVVYELSNPSMVPYDKILACPEDFINE